MFCPQTTKIPAPDSFLILLANQPTKPLLSCPFSKWKQNTLKSCVFKLFDGINKLQTSSSLTIASVSSSNLNLSIGTSLK